MTRTENSRAFLRAQTAARMIVENKERAERTEMGIRAEARRLGHSIDTRAEYAAGSAAAYSVCLSILTAVFGKTLDELTGEGWAPPRSLLPPEIPDGLAFGPDGVLVPKTELADAEDASYLAEMGRAMFAAAETSIRLQDETITNPEMHEALRPDRRIAQVWRDGMTERRKAGTE